jgi:hypothetical protein
MGKNANVCWIGTSEPWVVKTFLFASVCLPLNLDQNRQYAFHSTLSAVRRDVKRRADDLASRIGVRRTQLDITSPTRLALMAS